MITTVTVTIRHNANPTIGEFLKLYIEKIIEKYISYLELEITTDSKE